MRLLLACFAALLVAVGIADAAPRDLVAVTGTIAQDTRDQFMVLRGDDGRTYYVDLSRADRSEQTRTLGNRPVTVIGAQGARTDEIRAYIIDVFDNKPAVAQGFTDAPTGAFQRVHGTVESVSGATARVKTDEGRTLNVNLSELDRKNAVRAGERVTMVGRVEGGAYRAFWARARERDNDTFTSATTDRDEPGRWRRIHGTVESRSGDRMSFRGDNGRTWEVDLSNVPDNQRRGLERGEPVTIAGFPEGQRFVARYIAQEDRRQPGWQAGLPPRGTELTVNGQASSFEGRTFRFSSVDGQLMMVDSSRVSDAEHRLLASGQPVTVVGVRGQGDTIVAQRVTRDERHSRRPLDKIDPDVQKLQQLHGRVESASGDTVQMRTDEGRNVTLDITAVREKIARQLQPGDRITVTGFYREESKAMFSVRSLREADGSPAAAPRTEKNERKDRPSSKDECKDGGWRNFSNPSFKNQGDCVSWVNKRN